MDRVGVLSRSDRVSLSVALPMSFGLRAVVGCWSWGIYLWSFGTPGTFSVPVFPNIVS